MCLKKDDMKLACSQKSWALGAENATDTLSLFYRENITTEGKYSLILD